MIIEEFDSFNKNNNVFIKTIQKEDLEEVVDVLYETFGHYHSSKEELFERLKKRILNNLSICLKTGNRVVGVYLLNEKSINEFIKQIQMNEISDFPKNKTKFFLDEVLSNNGLQGIALCVLKSNRNFGFGKLLKEHTYEMGYDYIWGVQDKGLNNIEFWKKQEKYLQNQIIDLLLIQN